MTTPFCIGLSSQEMPLTSLVGTCKHTIGFYASGHVMMGSSVVKVHTSPSIVSSHTIGVVTHITPHRDDSTLDAVSVQFFMDGKQVVASKKTATAKGTLKGGDTRAPSTPTRTPLCSTFFIPSNLELFPTLTLYGVHASVLCRFSASDILTHVMDEEWDSTFATLIDSPLWCLDETKPVSALP